MSTDISRRRFLGGLGAVSAVSAVPAFLALPERLLALEAERIDVPTETLMRVVSLFARNPVVDFHTHLGIWHTMGLAEPIPGIGAITREKLAGNVREYLDAGVDCLYLDTISDIPRTRIGAPGNKDRDFIGDEAWEEYLRQYAMMQNFLDELPMSVLPAGGDVASISARGELAVILSTEGAHMVERDPSRLATLAEHGLRRLQPIHYVASELGDSQTDPERFGGLSDLGRDVLSDAVKRGMLLDMAHASEKVVKDTIDLTDRPLALSHTMVKYNSPRFGDYRKTRSRWVTPAHARMIAETGGVIGTFPIRAPFGVDTLDAFVEALKVLVDTVGVEHVAWSTDLGEPVRPAFLQDYRQFPRICGRLLDSGFSEADLVKFIGGNALRVQREAQGVAV